METLTSVHDVEIKGNPRTIKVGAADKLAPRARQAALQGRRTAFKYSMNHVSAKLIRQPYSYLIILEWNDSTCYRLKIM